jgi:Tfp pilus assembly protein PilW
VLTRAWRRLWTRARDERGTTLAELMIVVLLLGMIVAPAAMFLTSSQRNQRVVDESVRQQQDARIALDSWARAIREAGYPAGLNYTSSSLFQSASDNDVSFYSDIDNDGISEKVRYYLSGASVMRSVTNPDCNQNPCSYGDTATVATKTVLSSIRNGDLSACSGQSGTKPIFTYYSVDHGTGAQTQMPSGGSVSNLVDISFVKMTAVVDITPGKSPTCQTLETAVSLRNWRGG